MTLHYNWGSVRYEVLRTWKAKAKGKEKTFADCLKHITVDGHTDTIKVYGVDLGALENSRFREYTKIDKP